MSWTCPKEDWDFRVDKQVENIIDKIKEYFATNGPDSKAVIGMSGGKDSTILAKLLCMALGSENVIGVTMPTGDGNDYDTQLAKQICETFGMECMTINIDAVLRASFEALDDSLSTPLVPQVVTNIPPRVRMYMLYAVAAGQGGRVINTCNASEIYIGWVTKFGDGAGDFAPFEDFTVREILMIGDYLGIESEWVHKTPDDGLCGQSDEDKFGFTYNELDDFILHGIKPEYEKYKKIVQMNSRNKHKQRMAPFVRKLDFREGTIAF